jgi:hypothetical protein
MSIPRSLLVTTATANAMVFVLAYTSLGGVQNRQVSDARSGQPSQEPAYCQAWEGQKDKLDTGAIRSRVSDLSSTDDKVRLEAYAWLKNEVGLDWISPKALERNWAKIEAQYTNEAIARRKAGLAKFPENLCLDVQDWKDYADGLDTAVSGLVPLLLRSPRTGSRGRLGAVCSLRETPHPVFVPLLREIVQNKNETLDIRREALTTICFIPHAGMIEYLIDQLGGDLSFPASKYLARLTRAGFVSPPEETDAELQARYRKWWEENKGSYKYDASRIMMI